MKVKDQWQWLIKAEKPDKHDGAVNITYTRVSTQPMDLDNVGGSFKAIGDALVKAGIIEDDSPDIVQSLTVQWQKAESQKQQRSIIEIEDI
jgi:Holliday junction resolvase RusA-like endonuclease